MLKAGLVQNILGAILHHKRTDTLHYSTLSFICQAAQRWIASIWHICVLLCHRQAYAAAPYQILLKSPRTVSFDFSRTVFHLGSLQKSHQRVASLGKIR